MRLHGCTFLPWQVQGEQLPPSTVEQQPLNQTQGVHKVQILEISLSVVACKGGDKEWGEGDYYCYALKDYTEYSSLYFDECMYNAFLHISFMQT